MLGALSNWGMSERAACRNLGLSRRLTGYEFRQPAKDKTLGDGPLASLQALPRFGYRPTAA
jgi:hypothetical protein